MQGQLADEIIACLQGERTVYSYYRDRYGIGLLRHYCHRQPDRRVPVAALRRSAYAGLLEKPRIRSILAGCGHALDDAVLAASDYDTNQAAFVLTLSTWGTERRSDWRHQQTSRPGVNLVLQLNFNREHEQHYRRLGEVDGLFQYYGHPIARQRNTLAWARIDLDWASGSALIEEIQTDWLRRAADLEHWLLERRRAGAADDALIPYRRRQLPLRLTLDYCRLIGERYRPIWAEAMLWAAIAFLRDELGLRTLYYHSEDSGRLLKRIGWRSPPRSLYTDLPRRFCFRRGAEWPDFLLADKENRRLQRDHPGARLFCLDDSALA
ncbi:hypothetical protein [Azonexus sp.]|jgi:hypothetical protein|uniref:hypothetical protein n=1 Tax=Azonexus sp. TaxID=1872668 RepID=UPI002820DBB2|nr:hypothetical protein [Azonexus sp.]MDR1995521.1 hypothetical protein [Azonexus sp.]